MSDTRTINNAVTLGDQFTVQDLGAYAVVHAGVLDLHSEDPAAFDALALACVEAARVIRDAIPTSERLAPWTHGGAA